MSVTDMNEPLFSQALSQDTPLLVEFWAPWCTYCRRIADAYEAVAAQNKDTLVAARINIDEAPALASRERIQVVPTFVLYRGGKPLGSLVAPNSKDALDSFLRETLSNG